MPYAPTDDPDELERRRHLACKREARYREKNRDRRRASDRRANKKYERTEKGIRARARALERKRTQGRLEQRYIRMHVAEVRNIDRPLLLWLDPSGNLHAEEELSAEELIRRYEAKRRKDGHQ